MDNEGLLVEVKQGRVVRVLSNGVAVPAGAAVSYDGEAAQLVPVRQPTQAEQIERIVTALHEGRVNTQRNGIRSACADASKHYQALSQATGALATLLSEITRKEGDPAELLTGIQEAVNRIDDDVLREVRHQLLIACASALELRLEPEPEPDERPPAIPGFVHAGPVPPRQIPAEDEDEAAAAADEVGRVAARR